MSRVAVGQSTTRAPHRRAFLWLALGLLLGATLLVLEPRALAADAALLFGIAVTFFFPGYLLQKIIEPTSRARSLTRLPIFFVYSLALWAAPATLLQLAGANWFTFRVLFLMILWALGIGAIFRAWRNERVSPPLSRGDLWVEITVAVLCVFVALVVARGPRDADDWMYLQVTQQLLASDPFQLLQTSEARYSLRYAFHVWIFLQAYLGAWLNADLVTLLREGLPILLAPLALVSFFAWGKTFFENARAALLAVAIQLLIYVTFANGDGWGRGFLARSAQDKFLVWLVILPVGLSYAWRFLNAGGFANWFGYSAAVVAGLWVHPISVFLIVLTLAGLALFNSISRVPFSRRRWLWLTTVTLPALAIPAVVRVTTLPAVFTVNTPDVAAYIRLSEGRLLFQPPFYLADPALLANPLILLSLALLVVLAPRLRVDARVQFLWGSTLVPLALLFNPFTARLLGELLTPWQLWRMTWAVPAAFLLTEGVLVAARRLSGQPDQTRAVGAVGAVILAALLALSLSNLNLVRSFHALTKDHTLDPEVQDTMQSLAATLPQPSMVLLPRALTRFAPAYSARARVLSNDAQKEEDARGRQIDRFYADSADPEFLERFLQYWKIEYAVVPNDSPQDRFLRGRSRTLLLYRNAAYTLYRTDRAPP